MYSCTCNRDTPPPDRITPTSYLSYPPTYPILPILPPPPLIPSLQNSYMKNVLPNPMVSFCFRIMVDFAYALCKRSLKLSSLARVRCSAAEAAACRAGVCALEFGGW